MKLTHLILLFLVITVMITVTVMSTSFSLDCYCNSCESCNTQLSNSSCTTVYLTSDISTNETCIVGFNNTVFDCQGNKITGVGSNYEYGIELNNSVNSTVKNCVVTSFDIGILTLDSNNITIENCTSYHMNSTLHAAGIASKESENIKIYNSTTYDNFLGIGFYLTNNSLIYNNTLYNNTLTYNSSRNASVYIYDSSNDTIKENNIFQSGTGIYISNIDPLGYTVGPCSNITIYENTIKENQYGIRFESSNGTINKNLICGNYQYDLYSSDWGGTTGSENTCNKPDGWNDTGYTGCEWPCNSTCSCDSCGSCTRYLSSPDSCWTVKLTSSFQTVSSCIGINNGANHIFDCQNNYITGDDANGYIIKLFNTTNFTIERCNLSHYAYGVGLNQSRDIWIKDSIFHDMSLSYSSGCAIQDSQNVNITNSTFYNNMFGIAAQNLTHGLIENNTFFNITKYSTYNASIYLYDASNFNKIINNEIYSSGTGVYITYKDPNGKIYQGDSNNTIENNKIHNNVNGIKLEKTSFFKLFNNTIYNNTKQGVYLYSSNNTNLSYCNLTYNYFGISLVSSVYNNITNNNISNSNQYGILLNSSNNNKVNNNTIIQSIFDGIYLFDSNSTQIKYNFISLNDRYGISINNSFGSTIEQNKLKNNSYGLVSSNSNSSIQTNLICGNSNYDLYSSNWLGTTGSENTCNKPDGWNDTGYTGCEWPCNSTCSCDSCGSCAHYLYAPYSCSVVKIDNDLKTTSDCINVNNIEDKELNCDGNQVIGNLQNTFLFLSSGELTVNNCTIRSFKYGVTPSKSVITLLNDVFIDNAYGTNPEYSTLIINNSLFYKNRAGVYFGNEEEKHRVAITNSSFDENRCPLYFDFGSIDNFYFNLSLDNTLFEGLKGISLLNKKDCKYSNIGFAYLYNVSNCSIINSDIKNKCPGMLLINSKNNTISNTIGKGGIFLSNSNNNTLENINILLSPMIGLKFNNSNYNVIKNVTIFSPKDFDDHDNYGIYEDNSINYFNNVNLILSPKINIESKLTNKVLYSLYTQLSNNTYFYKPTTMNYLLRNTPIFNTKNIQLNFTIYYPNDTLCTNYNYTLKLDGIDVTSYTNKDGSNITLNYTVDAPGYHTAELYLTEYSNGVPTYFYQTYPIFVENYTLYNYTYYFRSLPPHLYQPTSGVLNDAGMYSNKKPYKNESINCIWWVQASIDFVPYWIPTIIKNVYTGLWESGATYFAIQRYVSYSKGGDINKPVTDGWNNINFTNLNYIISNPQDLYAIAFNLWFQSSNIVGNVTLYTKPDKPTYATLEMVKPSDIENFTSSNLNLTIEYIKYYENNITMKLFGNTSINTTIKLNWSNVYVSYNGKICPNKECSYTYSNDKLRLHASIDGNATIVISKDPIFPQINCLTNEYVNTSKVTLNFSATDNIKSFSYLDFNRSLLLDLPFDYYNQTLIDLSSYHNDVILGSSTSVDENDPQNTSSILGNALYFNGYDSYVKSITTLNISKGITVSAWIKPEHYKNYTWKMFGNYPTHNSTTNDSLISNDTLWSYNMSGSIYTSPVSENDKVFVVSYNSSTNSGELIAFDAETGEVIWNLSLTTITSSPAVDNGTLFVAATDSKLYAIDEDTGNIKWTFNYSSPVYSSLTIYDGIIYTAENNYKVYAINETNGNLVWKDNLSTKFGRSSPTVVGDRVYIASSESGLLYVLDRYTGKLIMKINLSSDGNSSTPVYSDKLLYISTEKNGEGELLVLDEYGNILWYSPSLGSTPTNYLIPTPAVDANYVYVPWASNLYSFNKYNGSLIWNDSIGSSFSSPIISRGILYIGSNDGKLYAINTSNGEVIWSKTIGNEIYSSPIISNQKLYIGSDNGTFYAIGKKRSQLESILLIGYQSDTSGYHWLYYDKRYNTISWQYTNGTKWKTLYCTVSNIFDGNWHLITVSQNYTSKNLKVYEDGLLKCNFSTDSVAPIINKNVFIGAYRSYSHFFKGDIDQVMIWDTVLSDSEVKALYDSTNKEFNRTLVLADGVYNYTAWSIDEAGNKENCSKKLVVDLYPPVISITSPKNGSCNNKNFLLNSSVTDNHGINYVDYIFNRSILFYIPFDENGNDVFNNYKFVYEDVNSSNYDGNTPPTLVLSKFGRGMKFDGVDDIGYIEFQNTIPINKKELTISLWVNAGKCGNTISDICGIIGGLGDDYWDSGVGLMYTRSKGNVIFRYGYNVSAAKDWITYYHYKFDKSISSNVSIDDGEWHLITAVIDVKNENMSLYIDGNLVNSTKIDYPISFDTSYFFIGGNGVNLYFATGKEGVYNDTFNGTIDNVIVFNTALTPKQVKELYNVTSPSFGTLNILNDSLVARYHFNEGSGTTISDDSGRGNNGTLYNAYWTSGKFGYGLKFNQSNSEVIIPNSNSLEVSNVTLSAWFNINGFPPEYSFIIDKGYNSGYRLYIKSDHSLCFQINNGTSPYAICGGYLNTNQWYHAIATYDSNVMKLYLNGNIIASKIVKGGIQKGTSNLVIGHVYWDNDSYTFNGTIDEIEILNESLNDAEVNLLFHSQTSPFKSYISNMEDGDYIVKLFSKDLAGNSNSDTIRFAVDTEKPIIKVTTQDTNNTDVCRNWEVFNISYIEPHLKKFYIDYDGNTSIINASNLWLYLPMNTNNTKEIYSHINFYFNNGIPDGKIDTGEIFANFENSLDGFNTCNDTAYSYIPGMYGNGIQIRSTDSNYPLACIYKSLGTPKYQNYTIWFYGKGFVNAGIWNGTNYNSYVIDVNSSCRTPNGETKVYEYCNNGNPYDKWHLFKLVLFENTSSTPTVYFYNNGSVGTTYAGQYDFVTDGPTRTKNGLSFDGVDDHAVVPYPNEFGNFTSLSIEIVAYNNNQNLNNQGDYIVFGNETNEIARVDGKIHISFLINGTEIPWKEGQSIPNGLTYIIIVYNGTDLIDYVNGTKEVYLSNLSGPIELGKYVYNLTFGGEGINGNINNYNGTIKLIRIYNKSLSDQEVNELLNNDRINDKLLAEWEFNSSDSVLYDTHMITKGKYGEGAYFNGYNEYLYSETLNNSWKLQNFSVEAWVYANDNSAHTWGAIVRGPFGTGYSYGWRLLYSAKSGEFLGQINFGDSTPIGLYASGYPAGKWYFVVFEYNHSQMALYVNGKLAVIKNESGDVNYISSGYPNIYIGGAQYKLNGIIDEVKIFNSSLSKEEIEADYLIGKINHEYNFTIKTEGEHSFNVSMVDCCNNTDNEFYKFHFVGENFYTHDLNMNNSNPKEGDTIGFNVTVENTGWTNTSGIVAFRIYAYNGTSWNLVSEDDKSVSLYPGEGVVLYSSWIAKPGRYKVEAIADPSNSVYECNESDNSVEKEFNVPAWATIYGNITGEIVLGNSNGKIMKEWIPTSIIGNIYVADEDSIFEIDNLYPLNESGDLSIADKALNMTGFNDSISNLYDQNGDGLADMWRNFTIVNKQMSVPVIYSDGSHNFYTGLLWDHGDGNVYNGSEDLVIIGNIGKNESDYGTEDYVVKVPSNLQNLKGSNRGLYLYIEIK